MAIFAQLNNSSEKVEWRLVALSTFLLEGRNTRGRKRLCPVSAFWEVRIYNSLLHFSTGGKPLVGRRIVLPSYQ